MILETQLEDLELELRTVRREKRRHFVWALTGISPAAFLPAVGLVLVESYGLFLILLFLVSFSQVFLGIKASGKEARLERAIEEIRQGEAPALR